MFPQSTSIGASLQNQSVGGQNPTQVIRANNNKQTNTTNMNLAFDWSYTDSDHSHQSDGEHKLHHFHYDRYFKSRRKMLLRILFKTLLVISHISSLLFASMHILY